MAQSSGTFAFQPSISEIVRVAFARCGIFAPAITIAHVADARFALNMILSDWGNNRSVNLAQVDQVIIPLLPGVITHALPRNTVDLLDVYLRNFTPSTTTEDIGSAITALGPAGNPTIGTPWGDPVLSTPGSNTLSCTAGSQTITLRWPAHQLSEGSPIFWGCPVSVGGLAISGFSVVTKMIDANRVQFLAPTPALENQNNQGATRLFSTNAGSATIDCIQPGHGISVGDTVTVDISLDIGGVTLSGDYTAVSVVNDYEFTFTADTAASAASLFENGGQLNVAIQSAGVQFTDVPMFPLSRTDYSNLSVKATPGRPTSYWLDRIAPPVFTTYPVAPAGSYYAFVAYRMREFEDALPIGGQVPDAPRRMIPALVAALTAHVAEIYRPEAWVQKVQMAEAAWNRAMAADVERVELRIVPVFSGYWR